jgi:glycosyltransferase involved in cell wall biosynthesis
VVVRVALVSTYPPRQCGIATFSSDLFEALRAAPKIRQVDVIAISNSADFKVKRPVVDVIDQGARDDYHRAARTVNRSEIDVVLIEHEFGIFGGADGEYLLSFVGDLSIPYVITLHTVLSAPSENQDRVLRTLCAGAASVLVFTNDAREIILSQNVADPSRVAVVPHGAPTKITALAEREEAPVPIAVWEPGQKQRQTTEGRFVVTSFGLLSEGKGLECAIEAIKEVAVEHPEVLFMIAGATHPEIVRREGESYRLQLTQKVRELGLGEQVIFDDRFLSIDELARTLGATDLFLTPYRGLEQTVSGALTFAVAAGLPVVSTPYRYALDLLKDGAGTIIPVDDAGALAAAITELIETPKKLKKMRAAAKIAGAPLSWPSVGRETAVILRRAAHGPIAAYEPAIKLLRLPPLKLDHLSTMIDDTGIVQHAIGSIPNRISGYCVDDVARLAQVAHQLFVRTSDVTWRISLSRSIAFLLHASDAGSGHELFNFMTFDRKWIGHAHHGDHYGRTIWALGELVSGTLPPSIEVPVAQMLDTMSHHMAITTASPRTSAFALLGLARSSTAERRERNRGIVTTLATGLVELYDQHHLEGWEWFEPMLTYDNARLPQALLRAGDHLGRQDLMELGLRTLAWLGDRCGLEGEIVQLPGNRWQQAGDAFETQGDEQPLDAAALVEAEIDAYKITGDTDHAKRATAAFEWFLGRNHLGLPLYDASTGGCRDGLSSEVVSLNEGAESTLAYLTARLAVEAAEFSVIPPQHPATEPDRLGASPA